MLEAIFGGAGLLAIGGLVTRHLNGRINRVEDKNGKHFQCLDEKVDGLNREVGEVKVVVERIDKKLP